MRGNPDAVGSASLLLRIDEYFDEQTIQLQRLHWAIATRRQLERWEPLVATAVRDSYSGRETEGALFWTAASERHFALIAARNLLRALDLDPANSVPVDPTLRTELIEGRDLLEHWRENMPVFRVRPRVDEPRHRSGKKFAERNPAAGPYSWLAWYSKTGPRLLPHVTAFALHDLLDAVEADVLAKNPELRSFVPPRAPSPWIQERGIWWPRPDDQTEPS